MTVSGWQVMEVGRVAIAGNPEGGNLLPLSQRAIVAGVVEVRRPVGALQSREKDLDPIAQKKRMG